MQKSIVASCQYILHKSTLMNFAFGESVHNFKSCLDLAILEILTSPVLVDQFIPMSSSYLSNTNRGRVRKYTQQSSAARH